MFRVYSELGSFELEAGSCTSDWGTPATWCTSPGSRASGGDRVRRRVLKDDVRLFLYLWDAVNGYIDHRIRHAGVPRKRLRRMRSSISVWSSAGSKRERNDRRGRWNAQPSGGCRCAHLVDRPGEWWGGSGSRRGGTEAGRHAGRGALRGALRLEGHRPAARREGDHQGGLQGRAQDPLGVGSRLRGRCVRIGGRGDSGTCLRGLRGGRHLRTPLVHEAEGHRFREADRLSRERVNGWTVDLTAVDSAAGRRRPGSAAYSRSRAKPWSVSRSSTTA